MSLLETVKKAAEAANEANVPAAFMFGSVTSTSPLTIQVDNRFPITGDAIVLTREFKAGAYPTHTHTVDPHVHTVDPHSHTVPTHSTQSGGDPSHTHSVPAVTTETTGLTSNQTGLTSNTEVYYGLAVGDKVVLLRNQGGQSFLVMGRV